MQRLIEHRTPGRANRERFPLADRTTCVRTMCALLLAATLALSGCGSNGNGAPPTPSLSGNWQFTVANPSDQSFLGGIQGGFLLQKSDGITGGAVYSVSQPSQNGGNSTVCNSGSAAITGTITGQAVTLTAVAGTQAFTFTGTQSLDGSTIVGTYTSTAGTAADGSPCGTPQTGLQWSATSVAPLTGSALGSFHSTGGAAGLGNQDFPVFATLTQGENIGASNATITGTLSFIDPTSLLSVYPCFDTASVNGQISGSSVVLQIIASDGSNVGQIGGPPGSGLGTVNFESTQQGYVLHSVVGTAYAVNSKPCPGISLSNAGDAGNICLALATSTGCQQPITLSPAFLIFPYQVMGTAPTTQTIRLSNDTSSGSILDGLQLQWSFNNGSFGGPSDFTGLPNFTEKDTCAASVGSTFSLEAGQSCTITVTFAPQQSCPWLPYGSPASQFGAAPAVCPLPMTATLTVNSPSSADGNMAFAVPITGAGSSAISATPQELDFGAEAPSQASLPQLLSFTNHGATPVQILSSKPCLNTPPTSGNTQLPRPLQETSAVSGLQVVANGVSSVGGNINADGSTIDYSCDSDPVTLLPNFQISSDTCTGTLLASQNTCSLQIAYVPQPATNLNSGLDHFLELNTLQCSSDNNVTSNCEIDSGRFPVELTANPPSPLRMSPGAGLDFGKQPVGQTSTQQTITLFNDPADPNSATVNFVSKVAVKGDYSESDDCPFSLAPGETCTLTVTFKPKIVGFDPGTLTINVTPEPTGSPQIVRLRGTGQ
jgi:hypothetical protein